MIKDDWICKGRKDECKFQPDYANKQFYIKKSVCVSGCSGSVVHAGLIWTGTDSNNEKKKINIIYRPFGEIVFLKNSLMTEEHVSSISPSHTKPWEKGNRVKNTKVNF